jgi:hypothetical protein
VGRGDIHIAESNHADSLPDTKSDSGGNAAVKTLDTVVGVDVLGRGRDVQVLGAVGVNGLGLKLDTNNLDGLVPSAQTTTNSRGGDLLDDVELLAALLASNPSDTGLGHTGQTEAGSPVGDLAHGNGIDTAVDTTETLGAPDAHECLHGTGGLAACSDNLVLGDLDRLHAGTETHGGVGLSEAARHAARDAGQEVGCAERLGVVLGFGGDEQEDGALGRGFDPGPRNEALVDCGRRGQRARRVAARHSNSQPRAPPRPQMREMAPDMPSDLLAAMVVLTTSKGCSRRCQRAARARETSRVAERTCPRVVTSNKLRPAPTAPTSASASPLALARGSHSRNRLLNLTGFFSSLGGPSAMVGTPVEGVELISGDVLSKGMGRTKAIGCFVAEPSVRVMQRKERQKSDGDAAQARKWSVSGVVSRQLL